MRRGSIAGGERAGWRYHRIGASLSGLFLLWSSPLQAADLKVQSSIDASETYTDNISLATSDKQKSDFVTQVTPGVSAHGAGSRSNFDVNYRLQNLIYANNANQNDVHNELSARGNLELAKDTLFVGAKSSISQQLVNVNSRVGLDNLNLGNRATVSTYGANTRLKLHWKSYMSSNFEVAADKVENEAPRISDAEMLSYSAQFASGTNFQRMLWHLNYRAQDLNRSYGGKSRRAGGDGDIRYRLSSTWNFLVLAGYEDNSLTQSFVVRNGSYWSAGLEWKPSRKLTASITAGNRDKSADLLLQPSDRSTFHLNYRKRDVGLIVGNNWEASFSHLTRHTVWRAQYFEENTATQTLQITGQQFFAVQDSKGNLVIDPSTGQPVILTQNIFSLGDDEFIRKRGQMVFTLNTGKSDVTVSAYREKRHYLVSQSAEDVVGTTASWNWRLSLRSQSLMAGSWQRRNPIGTNGHDDLWDVSLSLIQAIARDATASVSVSRLERNSYIPSINYHENRIAVQLSKRF